MITREKITITWDDVNSPDVDARLREQESKHREDAFTSPALSMGARQLRTQQRTSIWYNTVFAMAVFGLVGGLLAWGAGELIQLKPLTPAQYRAQLAEAQDQWDAVLSVQRRYAAGIDRATASLRVETIKEAAANNPYFQILRGKLPPEQQADAIRRQDAAYDTQAFLAKVLGYGLIGMIIALCLAVAEPLIDRNVHGVMINGAVGAMLGLFGGIVVSLFVDRLHQALGGTGESAELATREQVIANAIKYGVVGLFLTIAPGLLMRSFKKLTVGLLGGVVGGVIGGLLFAPAAKWTGSAVLARAVATVAIGLIAGLATGLIENAAKTGWLKVVQGFIAGKQFILYRATTYIGSSPDCHIYLFKDPAIGRRHAAVHVVPGGFDLEDLPLGSPTFVNGRRITRHRLRTGDQIQVGRTAFTFQEKAKGT